MSKLKIRHKISTLSLAALISLTGFNISFAGDPVAEGKEIAFDRKKGNCLACHAIGDGSLPGTQGPPLVAMAQRFPDKAILKAQIVNPLDRNQNSLMPPFGLHDILSDAEIDKIVEYLLTL